MKGLHFRKKKFELEKNHNKKLESNDKSKLVKTIKITEKGIQTKRKESIIQYLT